jgi:DNA-binding GntR family transcriptional regulator
MTEGNTVIHRRVLRDEVADYLIDAILSGSFRPGEKIVETRISKELQVSQGAVREAIRDLIAQGFLETEPYKGTRVREFTPGELGDYYACASPCKNGPSNGPASARPRRAGPDRTARHRRADAPVRRLRGHKNLRKLDIDFHKAWCAPRQRLLLRAWESLGNY